MSQPTPNESDSKGFRNDYENANSKSGFTLIETVIAMVIILIAVLGVLVTISYAIKYNGGNSVRTQTLAVLQQEIEQLRSAKFTPGQDQIPAGNTTKTVTVNNMIFTVTTNVNNDPFGSGEATTNIKEITVTVVLSNTNPAPDWKTAIPATVVLRRVRSN